MNIHFLLIETVDQRLIEAVDKRLEGTVDKRLNEAVDHGSNETVDQRLNDIADQQSCPELPTDTQSYSEFGEKRTGDRRTDQQMDGPTKGQAL